MSHCDPNHEDMGCECWCDGCNMAWDHERRLRHLAAFARALFYVCKAMGPPSFMPMRGRLQMPCFLAKPWWAWFDAAQAWVRR